ncbi:MAG: helix-hairpin-helix domain-containing protein [Candidatus Shapirobacteria bacterium]|nr:helix-hairpin-helix domain-containing protein [Candidatus Shapirobacteria bacterium]MDD3002659.1 helix-hairpin-helix domain-containing protein [Candidatus Shapirobacteria bacterium]MDD4382840.1 helix-hairpin-helix domain-containing protein [Candidatus Shapirobacteria bacterium]
MDLLKNIQNLKIVDGLLVLGFLLVILGIGINFRDQFMEKGKTEIVSNNVGSTEKNDTQINNEVTIDISGEVVNPGVYKLENGAILDDAIAMAGGLGSKANLTWIDKNLNRAEKLYDGQKIYIPNVVDDEKVILGVSTTKNIIRINTASLEDLDALNGVGPSIAQRIIDYRTENGGFKSIEEIKLVPGIGDKMFEKIKNDIQL